MNNYFAHSACPYIPDLESLTYVFSTDVLSAAIYEELISKGFRRNGYSFYKNICMNCNACIPIRVHIQHFRPSNSQKRVLKKNEDVTITRHAAMFEQEGFDLYKKYCAGRHKAKENEKDYRRFLIDSPVPTEMMRYYVKNRLIGLGWIDVLPHSLSSVYFAFDPDESKRSLGVYSVLKEIALCRELSKTWLQLGFWIMQSHKMNYKINYKPCQLLIDEIWKNEEEYEFKQ